jgi:hypothetical protein
MQDDILFYRWLGSEEERLLLMVPDCMKNTVLRGCHESKLAGHVGINNTMEIVKRNFMSYHRASDIIKYIKSCEICSRNKKLIKKLRKGIMCTY